MTWGSNPTFRKVPCRFCGGAVIDDTSDGPSHERACARRPLIDWQLNGFLPFALLVVVALGFAKVVIALGSCARQ